MNDETSILKQIWQQLKQVFEPDKPVNRAVSLHELDEKVWKAADSKYPMAWVHSTFTDSNGEFFAILSQDGQLYKSAVTILDNDQVELEDWQEVTQEFVPTQTRTTIKRQADGQVRWISRSATATLNRVGEIDSRSLFDSFVNHIEETGEYPIRQFYHQGAQFRTGQADFVARDDNVLITSGLYDDSKLARAEIKAREADPEYWGESIGYDPLQAEIARTKNDIEIPVYTAGVLREISTLPETEAANLFTATYQMEVNMLKGKVREAFDKLFETKDEADQWLDENVDDVNRSIEDTGMITRSVSDELVEAIKSGNIERAQELITTDEVKVVDDKTSIAQNIQTQGSTNNEDVVLDDDLVEVVVSRMVDSEPFKAITEQLSTIATSIKTLNENQQGLEQSLAGIETDNQDRFANLERSKEDDRREWMQDLPSQPSVTRLRYQPRQQQTENEEIDSNVVANETLNNIGLNY